MKFYSEPIMRPHDSPMRCQPLGHIGIATSGTAIYSWFPAQVKCPDVKDFEELDICEGHPSPFNNRGRSSTDLLGLGRVCGQNRP